MLADKRRVALKTNLRCLCDEHHCRRVNVRGRRSEDRDKKGQSTQRILICGAIHVTLKIIEKASFAGRLKMKICVGEAL